MSDGCVAGFSTTRRVERVAAARALAVGVLGMTLAAVVVGAVAAVPAVARSSQAPQRRQPPGVTLSPVSTLAIAKRQLSNGLSVWIVEQHGLPVVQMSLQVRAGNDADPPGRYGLASLTAAMLTEGAGSRSAVEIADTLDRLQANLSASSTADSSSVQLYAPAGQLATALQLMADVSQRPTFPTQELDRLRQQRLATFLNARDDPDAISALAFARGVFGPSHRSAAGPIGTREGIEASTAEDLKRFHESAYRPASSTLLAVGDVDPDEVVQLLERHFGKWQPAGASRGTAPRVPALQRPSRQLTVIDLPNAPQSQILVGSVGPASAIADLFPLQVLNTVLEGRFNSGRNQTLRDYTTGVRSGFELRKSAQPFVAGTAAQSDKTADSLRELLSELAAILKEIPADELARAKDEVARRFATAFEASGRISSRLQALISMVVYDLPDDYYATYVASIRSVSAPDVQRVAQQYLQPDHLVIVVVGDRKTIEPALRALNVAPIQGLSVDAMLGPLK
jgi:zinc protease